MAGPGALAEPSQSRLPAAERHFAACATSHALAASVVVLTNPKERQRHLSSDFAIGLEETAAQTSLRLVLNIRASILVTITTKGSGRNRYHV